MLYGNKYRTPTFQSRSQTVSTATIRPAIYKPNDSASVDPLVEGRQSFRQESGANATPKLIDNYVNVRDWC